MGNGASLDLLTAWAILRPMPGKGLRLRNIIVGDVGAIGLGWTVWEPSHQVDAVTAPEPMFPGYMFVRPPTGQRRYMRQLPFSAGPLEIVISDRFRAKIEAEEQTRRRRFKAVADRQRAKREVRVFKSFQDLASILGAHKAAMPIDSESGQAQVWALTRRDSVAQTALLSSYERTDDDAGDATLGAEAMVRLKNYFT